MVQSRDQRERFFMRAFLLALLVLPLTLKAQDERRVLSPNGQIEFRLFVAQPEGALWGRIGYQVFFRGKPLLATSWMGLDIRDQEPFLGENPGFMSSDSRSDSHGAYNSLVAHYMQNGSLGRRVDVEVRAYDNGVAFRYVIPESTPLSQILIRDEATEFNFAQPGALSHISAQPDFDLPFTVEEPGIGRVTIAGAGPEAKSPRYPRTYLIRSEKGLVTNLARSKDDPTVAFAGTTPLIWPWRAVLLGPESEAATTLQDLNH
jgi:Glycosyl-hydrolase 97 N-terminal